MNKTKFFSSLLVVALFATASVVTSCKDYDDDIKNLQSQIDGINKTLSQIQTLISSGSVITDVKTLTDGTGGVEIGSSMVLTLASPLAVRRVRLVLPVLPVLPVQLVLRVPKVRKVKRVTRVKLALPVHWLSTTFPALRVMRRATG